MSEPYAVPATTSVHTLFQEMCRRKQHMTIILDEWGGTLGLVTMEDILEELVGDIYEEETEESPSAPAEETPAEEAPARDGKNGEVAE